MVYVGGQVVINISGRDVVACERGSIVVVEHSDSECVSLQKCSGSAVAGGRPKRAHRRFIPVDARLLRCAATRTCASAACPWRQIRMGRQLRITADQYKQCWGDRIATDQDKLVDLLQKQADAAAAAPSPTPAAPASRAPSDAASDVASVSGSTSRSSVPSSRMDARLKVEDLQEKLAAELRMRDELEMRLASIRGQ